MPFDLSTAREVESDNLQVAPAVKKPFDLSTAREIPLTDQHTYRETTKQTVAAPQGMAPEEIEFLDDVQNQGKPRAGYFGYTGIGNAIKDIGKGIPEFFSGLLVETPALAAVEVGERLQESAQKIQEPLGFDPDTADFSQIYEAFKKKPITLGGLVGTATGPEVNQRIIDAGKKVYRANDELLKKYGLDTNSVFGDIGAGVGSVGTAVATTLLTRNPLYAAAIFGTLQKTQTYKEARDAGLKPGEAGPLSTKAGMTEAGLEALGNKVFLALGESSKRVTRIITRTIEETAQETLQQAGESLLMNYAGVRNQTGAEIAKDIGYAAMIGALVSAPVSTVADFAEQAAIKRGLPPGFGTELGTRVYERRDEIAQAMAQEVENGVAPLANDKADEDGAAKIIKDFQDGKPITMESLSEQDQALLKDMGVELPAVAAENATGTTADSAGNRTVAAEKAPADRIEQPWLRGRISEADNEQQVSAVYPAASDIVDGLKVRPEVHNTESIPASFENYEEVTGIREVPFDLFLGQPPENIRDARTKNLAQEISESGEINPLIVAIDKDGPYILEGAHRFDALRILGKQSFPAKIVLDMDSIQLASVDTGGGSEPPITPPTDLSGHAEPPKPERDIAGDLAAVREQADPSILSSLWQDTKNLLGYARQSLNDQFVPMSTRFNRIDPSLKFKAREFVFKVAIGSKKDTEAVKPFMEAFSDKATPEDYKEMDFAVKNGLTNIVGHLAGKYGLDDEYSKVQDTLEDIGQRAQAAGIDMNLVPDRKYWPRRVTPERLGEFIAYLRGQDKWSHIEMDMKRADPNNEFTPEQKTKFIDTWLRGYTTDKTTLAKPSFSKERSIEYITPEMNEFYEPSFPTLLRYINNMNHAIQAKKLFGVTPDALEESIGAHVGELIEQGKITAEEEVELKDLLRGVVQPIGSSPGAQFLKNVGYIYVMGSPTSAITQIGDLAFSFAINGIYNTSRGLAKSVAGKQTFTKKDLGLESIAEELEDPARSSSAVRTVFKSVGLNLFDNIGIETFMDGAYSRLKDAATKENKALDTHLDAMFGERAEQVKQELLSGEKTEDVTFLVLSEVLDVQPRMVTEMPLNYALNKGIFMGRIGYMLQSYPIKQLDTMRRLAFSQMSSTDEKQFMRGVRNLAKLSFFLFLLNASSDYIKDFMLDRETEPEDLVRDNIIRLMGVSKYQIRTAVEEGPLEASIPPIFAFPKDLYKDVRDMATDRRDIEDLRIWGHIPLVGKIYDWRWGGSSEKE